MAESRKSNRFTYGDQFAPEKFSSLTDLLELAVANEPDRYKLQGIIRASYFEGHGRDVALREDNSTRMAMNCVLSLNAYGLIQFSEKGTKYLATPLTHDLLLVKANLAQVHNKFAIHILTNLEGLLLARLIERIRARGEQVTLEYLGEEMNDLGKEIPPNSTYISTMRSWLAQAGVFRPSGYEINWDVIYELLKVDANFIDELYHLTTEQKDFLLSMANMDIRTFTPPNKIAEHARSVYKVRLTRKNLVKDILEPLETLGLIQTRKTTSGRRAKPHEVYLTEKSQIEILQPLLANVHFG